MGRGRGGPSSLTDRLMSRGGGSLHSRRMPDGGEVFGGPVATRALAAVGARAMTLDHSIIVGDNFNVSTPEDLALYDHERHHMENSGGEGGHGAHDAEEMQARARERLVLQRAQAGDDHGSILNEIGGQSPRTAGEADQIFDQREGRGSEDHGGRPDPMEGYRQAMADGKSHAMMVRELADYVVQTMQQQNEGSEMRSAEPGE